MQEQKIVNSPTIDADLIFADLERHVDKYSSVYVGYSGGLDSTVLLDLAKNYFPQKRITAVHINHGLSHKANTWQEHAQRHCRDLSINFEAHLVDCSAGRNAENSARFARYQVFEKLLKNDDILLLAHHADDQAETVVYHLLRGSGSLGMSGIPVVRQLGQGKVFRPLLGLSRQQLSLHGENAGLSWVEDESNFDTDYDRNYLRHKVMPLLADRWSGHQFRIAASASQSKKDKNLAKSIFDSDLHALDMQDERAGLSICLERMNSLEIIRQQNIIRHLPALLGYLLPGSSTVCEVINVLLSARPDGAPRVMAKNYEYRRYRNRIYLLRTRDGCVPKLEGRIKWQQPHNNLILPDGSSLLTKLVFSEGLRLDSFTSLEIGYRNGGERCKPCGRQRSQTLKRLFQEHALEPWWRSSIPLFFHGQDIVAVGDLWICEGWQADEGERGLQILWQVNSL